RYDRGHAQRCGHRHCPAHGREIPRGNANPIVGAAPPRKAARQRVGFRPGLTCPRGILSSESRLPSLDPGVSIPRRMREAATPFRVSGKTIAIGEALRARVNPRIAEAPAKYFDGGYSGHVTIGKDGFGFRTDCVIHLDSGT